MARFFSGFHGGLKHLEEGMLTSQSFQDVMGTPLASNFFFKRCGVGKEESQAEAEELPLGVSCGFESWPEG